MFAGHYGPAGAGAGQTVKLWHCFIAVQFLDLIWAPLVLTGAEGLRITPGYTASNHLDLFSMPYSHSLIMAVLWSVVAGAVYALLRPQAGRRGALLIGCLVFSHWLLDFVAHRPDLALWFGGPKAGLGLWNNRPVSFSVEIALYALGVTVFWARTTALNLAGRFAPPLLIVLGVGAQYLANWGAPPSGPHEAAATALAAYAAFTGLAALNDANRRYVAPSGQRSNSGQAFARKER